MDNSSPIFLIRLGLFSYVSYTTYKTFPSEKVVDEAIETLASLQTNLSPPTSYISRVSHTVFSPLTSLQNSAKIRKNIKLFENSHQVHVQDIVRVTAGGLAGYYAVRFFDSFRKGFL